MIRPLFICVALLALLCACGKRPEVMEVPEGANAKAFPRHYPDVHTDPQGTYVPPNVK